MLLSILSWNAWVNSFSFYDSVYHVAMALLAAFALHFSRFFFVHGRTPRGRALKIDAEIEREWHRARERSRHEAVDGADASAARELGDGRGRRMGLSDEGEFEQLEDQGLDRARAGAGACDDQAQI